jgi:hypothetical protein
MIGVGPQWGHTRVRGPISNSTSNAWSGEVVLDFMFWPSAKHKFGWYVEPSYEYSFARGHERSVGITGGLLIAIRLCFLLPGPKNVSKTLCANPSWRIRTSSRKTNDMKLG